MPRFVACALLPAWILILLACLAPSQAPGEEPKQVPGAAKPPRRDGYGDPLPQGAWARLGTVRVRSASGNYGSILFSRDGKSLIEGEFDQIRIWDTATGRKLRQMEADHFGVCCLALSPDGTLLASGGLDKVGLWDAASGHLLWAFEAESLGRSPVAFSPDGKVLAAGSYSHLRLRDVKRGKVLRIWATPAGCPRSIAFAPDGKTFVTGGGDRRLRFWDVATGKQVRPPLEEDLDVAAVAFSPDGKLLASAGLSGSIHLWDACSGKKLSAFESDYREIRTLAFSPDGKLLASAGTPGPRLWRVPTGERVAGLQGVDTPASSVAFSRDGRLLAALGRAIRVWDLATGRNLASRPAHQTAVRWVGFAPDGRTVASIAEDVRTWDPSTGEPLPVPQGQGAEPEAAGFTPDGKGLMAVAGDRVLRAWDPRTGKPLKQLPLSGDASQGDRPRALPLVRFCDDGKRLVLVSQPIDSLDEQDTSIDVYDTGSGRALLRRERHSVSLFRSALSCDGRMLAYVSWQPTRHRYPSRSTVVVWNMFQDEEPFAPPLVKGTYLSGPVVFSPDGRKLVAERVSPGGPFKHLVPRSTSVWELASGQEILNLPARYIERLAFSPDGRLLVTSAWPENSVEFWDMATGKKLLGLPGSGAECLCLALAPDGRTLASGHADSTILLWRLPPQILRADVGDSPVAPERLARLWEDLAYGSAFAANQAIWTFVAEPDKAIPFLRSRLQLARAAAPSHVQQLISELDSDRFSARRQALRELQRLDTLAEPALRRALEGKLSAEQRRRIQQLLAKLHGAIRVPETLRAVRAVEVLERIGSPEAQQVLESLAKGAPESRITQHATRGLARLARRVQRVP